MAKKEEFDLEFDFEKELGFDPKDLLGEEYEEETMEELILDETPAAEEESAAPAYETMGEDEELDFLNDDFLASLGIVLTDDEDEDDLPMEEITAPEEVREAASEAEEPVDEIPAEDDYVDDLADDYDEILDAEDAAEEDYGFDMDAEEAVQEETEVDFISAPRPAFDVDSTPDLGEDFAATYDEVAKEQETAPEAASAEDTPAEKAQLSDIPKRRRKMSKERIIKEVYLPPIIAGLALILILCFVGGAIGRGIKANKDAEEALKASNEASMSALQQEADRLLSQAYILASGYDYDAALNVLNSFSGEKTEYKEIIDAISAYTQAKNNIAPIDDPASIPNLSFHGLIADPARAFASEKWRNSFNNNYVTIDEFSKILQSLYDKGYVLVDFDSFVVETTGEDGKTTYASQPIYLPADKKPIMLTETLVNYETFTIDSDGDGEADAGGLGFASKLIVDASGKIVNEMVDASGNTVTGSYDLVPILEDFIAAHPDFCYRGARAILAVSGEDGVFGYRTMHSVKESKGNDYYNQQVEGAKKIAQALRDAGYTIACYTYGNVNYSELSATSITADLDVWDREIDPVLGEVDMIVYAKGCDISYTGNRYNVLKDAGFRYFIGAAGVPYSEINTDYVRQSRIMVTGSTMTKSPSTFANYFDAASVLNTIRNTK